MLRPAPVALVLALASLGACPPRACANPPVFRIEATLGGAWRTSIDYADRNPGFEAGGLQLEVALGPAWGPFALLAGAQGRVGFVANSAFYATTPGATPSLPTWYEAGGHVGFQLALGERIRARLGGTGAMSFIVDRNAPLVGGFLAMTFDATTWKTGRLAAILLLRLDVEAVLRDDDRLPRTSTSLAAGVGIRY